ncbi:MAG: type II toxin-antitoxin system HicA family toxin [Bacteroidota bacterium]
MRLPQNLDGKTLIRRLRPLGYEQTRQSGSHVRLTRTSEEGQQHVTVPLHKPLRVGTLNAILAEVAGHLQITKAELIQRVS